MATAIRVETLHAQLGGELGLRWRAPCAGGDTPLHADTERQSAPTVGYLNAARPPQIQIIGRAEHEYLRTTGPELREHMLARLADSATVMVIVADATDIDADMAERLTNAGVAVFDTVQDSQRISYRLRHFLSRALARETTVHGVFLEILSLGVLITGEPGVGKSELALELITRGHRLVADDAPEFALLGPDDLNGGCPGVLQDFLEVRGLGLLNIRAMFGEAAIKRRKQLGLIIRMMRYDDPRLPEPQRLTGSRRTREILEVTVPEITLPVAPGQNLAVLVEAACRDHLLRAQGYHSDEVFAQRQESVIRENDA